MTQNVFSTKKALMDIRAELAGDDIFDAKKPVKKAKKANDQDEAPEEQLEKAKETLEELTTKIDEIKEDTALTDDEKEEATAETQGKIDEITETIKDLEEKVEEVKEDAKDEVVVRKVVPSISDAKKPKTKKKASDADTEKEGSPDEEASETALEEDKEKKDGQDETEEDLAKAKEELQDLKSQLDSCKKNKKMSDQDKEEETADLEEKIEAVEEIIAELETDLDEIPEEEEEAEEGDSKKKPGKKKHDDAQPVAVKATVAQYRARVDNLKKARNKAHSDAARVKRRSTIAKRKITERIPIDEVQDAIRAHIQEAFQEQFDADESGLSVLMDTVIEHCTVEINDNELTLTIPVWKLSDEVSIDEPAAQKIVFELEDDTDVDSIIAYIIDTFDLNSKLFI